MAAFDIITAVNERGLWHVLANIFDRVSPEDIRAATAVSVAWRAVDFFSNADILCIVNFLYERLILQFCPCYGKWQTKYDFFQHRVE